jgi:hypothetical protein
MTILRKVISLIAVSLTLSSCGKKDSPTPNNPPGTDAYAQFIVNAREKVSIASDGAGVAICASLSEHYPSDLYTIYAANLALDNHFNYFDIRFFEKNGDRCSISQFFETRISDSVLSARAECSIIGQKFNTSCFSKG